MIARGIEEMRYKLVIIICTLLMLIVAVPAQSGPSLISDEEYKVFAAVLFPGGKGPSLNRIGQGSASAVIDEETAMESIPAPRDGADVLMIEDFNRKNKERGKILEEKFKAFLPKDKSIEIITREKRDKLFSQDDAGNRNGWDKFRSSYPFAGGIVDLSRVGFDEKRSRAVVFVREQAHYRMGVGYIVYLEKSAVTGKWSITDALLAYKS